MTKYNPKFKHQVIKEYLNGNVTYAYLTQKYQISSSKQVQEWVRQYKLFGKKGLERKQRQDYTGEFRLNVLNYMKTTGVSYSITANHFGISDIGTIANWNTKFLRDGIEAFFKPKGRPRSPMTKAKQSKQSKTLTREQQLEEENK